MDPQMQADLVYSLNPVSFTKTNAQLSHSSVGILLLYKIICKYDNTGYRIIQECQDG